MKQTFRTMLTLKAFEFNGEQVTTTLYTGDCPTPELARDLGEALVAGGVAVAYRVVSQSEGSIPFNHHYVRYQPHEYDHIKRVAEVQPTAA